jgi:PLP dependent protein
MISENIAEISGRIMKAADRAGRLPGEVRLVAVSKTVGADSVQDAIDEGLRIFGENRVQEAREKKSKLNLAAAGITVEWHLIGHLQRNKAGHAVELFELIHSVDSAALADELDRHAGKAGKNQKILVEVKLSEEDSKQGITENDLERLLAHVSSLRNIVLKGLMTMPPFIEDPEGARPYFRRLRELRDELQGRGFSLPELSMGMSNDFEVAIEEGATLVRIGTAIFGERR